MLPILTTNFMSMVATLRPTPLMHDAMHVSKAANELSKLLKHSEPAIAENAQMNARAQHGTDEPRISLSQWCHDQSVRTAAHNVQRARSPLMTSTLSAELHDIEEKVKAIRKEAHPHRDARRELKSKLSEIERDRREWDETCEGEHCEVHSSELQYEAEAVTRELDLHRAALEALDAEQRNILISGYGL